MTDLDRAFPLVVGAEGGLTMDPNDPGNWTSGARGKGVLRGTKFGISAAQYPAVDIADLTLTAAKAIYQRDYWAPAACDVLPWPLNYLIFDTVVNQGGGPSLWKQALQTAIGAAADGNVGPKTVAAARLVVGNAEQLLEAVGLFTASRIDRYVEKSDPKYQHGLYKRATVTAMRCVA